MFLPLSGVTLSLEAVYANAFLIFLNEFSVPFSHLKQFFVICRLVSV